MNYRVILRINAGVILALGLALLFPLAISFIYRDGSWASFAIPAAVMMAIGSLGFWTTRPVSDRALVHVSNRDVLFSVTMAWLLAALLGGVPYLIEGTFST
ncbi:hypothetical protein BH23ACT11_BH23ACT11_29560 [soil metagenome]